MKLTALLNICLITMIIVTSSCQEGSEPGFRLLSPEATSVDFVNAVTESEKVNILNYYYCYNGSGVGIADFNKDGMHDIFFGGNMVSSRLYLNKGSLQFEDVTSSSGVSTKDWIMGVSVVDINSDGWMDIYLSVAGPVVNGPHHNLLFVNDGMKDGQLRFTEAARAYGLNDSSFNVQSVFLDYDRDGDLDVYLLTNDVDGVEKTFVNPASFPITRGKTIDRLYENRPDSTGKPFYVNVSANAGITHEGYGLGVAVDDFNLDGWPDVYAANDFMPNDHLYINSGKGFFNEVAMSSMPHQTYNGMGVDAADINNDGRPDIMVLDMLPENNERRKTMIARADHENFRMRKASGYVDQYMRNTLQLNNGTDTTGRLHFSEIGQMAGVHATDWSWSVLFADLDNDGWKDAFVTNGFYKNIADLDFISYNGDNNTFGTVEDKVKRTSELLANLKGIHVPNYFFRNIDGWSFEDVSGKWDLDRPSFSNGAAYADLDNDGDLDLVTNNINEPAFIYENRNKNGNNHIQLKLNGKAGNLNAIGATIKVYCGEKQYYYYNSPARGYLSSMQVPIQVGLGSNTSLDSIVVQWPEGSRSVHKVPDLNKLVEINNQSSGNQGQGTARPTIFYSLQDQLAAVYAHKENDFDDFAYYPLLPKMFSRKGPCVAVGDANNDGLEDFFMGGSKGYAGTLFLQQKDGKFNPVEINREDAGFEDQGALFFDLEGDGDLDLYVVSGGTESLQDSASHDRLYINDGYGRFTRSPQSLPKLDPVGTCIVAADMDRDGDLDLFRGGGTYPLSIKTNQHVALLRNDNGVLVEATEQLATGLSAVSMINSAVWSDIDLDGWPDLLIAGDWGSPMIWLNRNGKLYNETEKSGLSGWKGWWNSLYPVDIDEDGDTDFIAGNAGTNLDFAPTEKFPLELRLYPFNGSARPQPVLVQYLKDEKGEKHRFPFHYRDDLFREMPIMKKVYWNYDLFSHASVDKLFPKDEWQQATKWEASYFESGIMVNEGNARFSFRPLPAAAQVSCINGVLANDIDGDGHLDLILSGNNHGMEAVNGLQDASIGCVLKGDGKGGFRALDAQQTGLFLRGDMRGMAALLQAGNTPLIIAAANSSGLQLIGNRNIDSGWVLKPGPRDVSVTYHLKGELVRKELYHGYGYFSQSTRSLLLPDELGYVEVTDSKGQKRRVSNNQANH